MQKLIKNWIFTLIVCILLSVLSLLMFLSYFDVGGMRIGRDLLHLVAAVMLGLYTVFVMFPIVARYRGTIQAFAIAETGILLLTAVAQACSGFFVIPFFATLQVFSVLGLVLWLRGAVETVHAYLLRGTDSQKKIPLWGLCLYILLSAFGIWQVARPSIQDKYFILCIAIISLVIAALFGYATAINRRNSGATARAQQRRAKKQAERDARAQSDAPALPAPRGKK